MRKAIVIALLAAVAVSVTVTVAVAAHGGGASTTPATSGRLVFGRYNSALDDTVIYTVNPDGRHLHRVLPFALECPHWSPDGTRIATCGNPHGGATLIVNPRTGRHHELPMPDPTLFTACSVWSPTSARLACESFGQTDPSRNGIYTIRSTDGRGLRRMTSNPGGDDLPGSYSPDGKRFVFSRDDKNGDAIGLFVVNVDRSDLHLITPPGTLLDSSGDWSPHGNQILFSRHATPNVHDSIWVVRADGSGLHEIHVQPSSACGGPTSDPNARGCFDPRWSPNGKEIAFARTTSTGTSLYTINADGSHLLRVTHGGSDEFPDWGPLN